MTEQNTLAKLSLKDLRQLAGEHQIQSRSKLTRHELVSALAQVLAAAAPAAALAASANSSEVAAEPVIAVEAAAPVAVVAISEPAPADAEPEMLTPESVAALAEPAPEPASDAPAPAVEAAAADGALPPTDAETGEPGRRRRRRRRRRGGRGGRSGDGASATQDVGDDEDDEDGPDDEAEAVVGAPAPAAEAPVAAAVEPEPALATPAIPAAEPTPAPAPARIPAPTPVVAAPAPRAEARPVLPARPRISGEVRPVGSVLDRLRSFAGGILELCDPSTPSWAQPRMAELLAECGVVPIPCQGEPHPEYHRVVGTVAVPAMPNGHIAEVSAPGFALRGDRGDLFPLRQAQVRVASSSDSRIAAPVAPAPSAPVAVVAASVSEESAPTSAGAAPARERRDERRPRHERERRPPPATEPEVTSEVAASVDAPVADVAVTAEPVRAPQPSPGRRPEQSHPREAASNAPLLPLAAQVADELAQRPKAEGFRALGLNEQILADLAAINYQQPTPIQAAAIPVALAGKDLLGQAQTGTGKTAAFVLPLLQKLYSLEGEGPVALVLLPTRELARQVHSEFVRMAGRSGARAALVYGGVPMEEQFRSLDRKPHVVIGTPGRVIDHMKRRTLDLSHLSVAILDEADQMLDIGFWPDVNYIISHTPPARQIMMFSATFPEEVQKLIDRHMKTPERINITPENPTVERVDQKYIAVPRERKNDLLARFIEIFNPPQLVVFCKTKHQTDRVAEVLKRKNMSAGAIHGDLPQSKRERTLQDFRNGTLQSLVATNVAARGLDIPSVSHVVNYDVPETPEEYVHRIGRTARNGAEGVARTFITPEDGQFLIEIEKHIGLLLDEEQVPGFELAAPVAAPVVNVEAPTPGPRLLKPLVGGIRLGRRR